MKTYMMSKYKNGPLYPDPVVIPQGHAWKHCQKERIIDSQKVHTCGNRYACFTIRPCYIQSYIR